MRICAASSAVYGAQGISSNGGGAIKGTGGVTGIVVPSSIGEVESLSRDEQKQVVCTTRQTLDQNDFKEVIIIAEMARVP